MKIKLFFIACLLCLVGCRRNAATDKPVLTVSIEPERWLLERLVGDRMEVRTLLEKGANPESYDPSFNHLAELERSSAYFTVGNLGFESAIVSKLASNNPDLPIICVSDSIELIHASHGSHDHGVDPHVWNSAKNMRMIARRMTEALQEIDSLHSEEYEANYLSLVQHIDSIDAVCDSILSPVKGASFMVWHPSLSYFARDYGLNQLSLGAEGKEHSIGQTRALLEQMDMSGAEVFLIQKDFDAAQAQALAREVRTVVIDPMNYEWDTEMLHTARAIARRD